jgi:hypothetical protein
MDRGDYIFNIVTAHVGSERYRPHVHATDPW